MRQLPVVQVEGLRKVYIRPVTFANCSRSERLRRITWRHEMAGPGGMPRAGRPRQPNCGNEPARPQRSSLDHAVPVHRRRLCGRKKTRQAASLSVGAGRARRATRGSPAEPSPRDRVLPAPSIFLREVGRHQPGRFAPVRFGQRSPRKLLAAVVADGIEMDARR